MSTHGNEGNRVKNLRSTSGCAHYKGYAASSDSEVKCAVNGCNNKGIRACHVIYANQNATTGTRYIVYMCSSHNAIYNQILDVRANAKMHELKDCPCGEWP